LACVDATVTASVFVSMSGVSVTASMALSGTGSIQTVCQIPVTDVYQMPFGRLTCLPRGYVGSHTPTSRSCGPFGRSASVMSSVNAS
jgi:hypothetical protein